MRRRLALWICPDLRDEIAALQSGNTKVVLENDRLLDELEKHLEADRTFKQVIDRIDTILPDRLRRL